MKEIIFATKNKGKLTEVQNILGNEYIIKSLEDEKVYIDIEEDGKTFQENSFKKAFEMMKLTNKIVMADDSGLEIDFLNNAPGVHSARYMGVDTPYSIKNKKIIELLENVSDEQRTARFICVITTVFPNGDFLTSHGVTSGFITREIKGEKGFGYDPIFFVKEKGLTMAEMTLEEKNLISHRAKALEDMKIKLRKKWSD